MRFLHRRCKRPHRGGDRRRNRSLNYRRFCQSARPCMLRRWLVGRARLLGRIHPGCRCMLWGVSWRPSRSQAFGKGREGTKSPSNSDSPAFAFIARPATKHPSTSLCGSPRIISRSLHVPGSPSSAFTTRYRGRGSFSHPGLFTDC